MANSQNLVLILVTILFPPAAVAMMSGCSCDLLINILLTILGYIPGHIHAFWLIYIKTRDEDRARTATNDGYNYVGQEPYNSHAGGYQAQQAAPYQDQPMPQPGPPAYGAVSK